VAGHPRVGNAACKAVRVLNLIPSGRAAAGALALVIARSTAAADRAASLTFQTLCGCPLGARPARNRSRRATDRFLRRIVQSRRGEPRRSIRGACVCRTSHHYNSVGRSGRGCTTACDERNARVACRVCVCSRVRGRRHRLSPAPGALLSHRRNSVARLRALRRSVRERWRYRCARPPHRPVAAPSAHRTDAACPAHPDRLRADRYQLARRTG